MMISAVHEIIVISKNDIALVFRSMNKIPKMLLFLDFRVVYRNSK